MTATERDQLAVGDHESRAQLHIPKYPSRDRQDRTPPAAWGRSGPNRTTIELNHPEAMDLLLDLADSLEPQPRDDTRLPLQTDA
jgi:hypothetical protein